MRQRPVLTSLAIVLAVLASACAAEPTADEVFGLPDDPTSTADVVGPGGQTARVRTLEDVAAETHAAVVATIVDVQKPRFTTPTGSFPGGAYDRSLRDAFTELTTMTPIVVRIDELLGRNPASTLDVNVGDLITIDVPVGAVAFTLGHEQMQALGFRADEFTDDAAPDAQLPDSAEFLRGVGPSIDLTEGDQTVLFLMINDQLTITDSWEVTTTARLTLVSSLSGTFKYDNSGGLSTVSLGGSPRSLSEDEVREIAQALNSATGPPRGAERR